jgi:hypothetical protein
MRPLWKGAISFGSVQEEATVQRRGSCLRPSEEHSADPGKGQRKKARDESPSKIEEGAQAEEGSMKGFLRDNGLSLVLLAL